MKENSPKIILFFKSKYEIWIYPGILINNKKGYVSIKYVMKNNLT